MQQTARPHGFVGSRWLLKGWREAMAGIGRRAVIGVLGGAAFVWPYDLIAQPTKRVRRLGVLMGVANDPGGQALLAAFQTGLKELGWNEGGNIRIDYRWGAGDADRGRKLATELVELQPDAIFCQTTQSVMALRQATRTIPIVFVQVSDPVGSGFVGGLSRPGGNATGFTNFETSMGGKWLELLKEIVPRAATVALMFNPISSPHIASGFYLHSSEEASRLVAVEALPAPVHDTEEIERAIDAFAAKPNGALIVLPDTFNIVHSDLIIRSTAQHRLPAIYPFRSYATRGGLASYGVNPIEQYPRAALYVDRILRGEKPGDLPVQAPTKFELVVNLRTAKALALDVPLYLQQLADEVIE
jgi:putative ABC transport system substrate-binding protein